MSKRLFDWEQLAHPGPKRMLMYASGYIDNMLNEINCNQSLART